MTVTVSTLWRILGITVLTFSGRVDQTAELQSRQSSCNGRLYGPQAAELGGSILDSDRKFGAVFGAKKMTRRQHNEQKAYIPAYPDCLGCCRRLPSYAANPETAALDAAQSQSLKEVTVRAAKVGRRSKEATGLGKSSNVGNVEQRTGTRYPRPDALRSGRGGCRTGQRRAAATRYAA